MIHNETIIICDSCEGSGKTEHSERYDYHHRYDWEWDEPCTKCGGHGRLIKIEKISFRKLNDEDLKLRPKPEKAE